MSTGGAVGSQRSSPHVHLRPGVDARFVDVDDVLQQLLDTLETPKLWSSFWDERVPGSGSFGSAHPFPYKFSDIAAALARYLTDRKLNIGYRTAELKVGGGLTTSRTEMFLYEVAGRGENGGRYVYSDYSLARTIFHELMHVFQYDYWTATGRSTDYEGFPTATEPKLPKTLFNTCEYIDPGGQAAMPPSSADPKSCQASYEATVYTGGNHATSTWTLRSNNGTLSGTSKWSCCPGPRVDALKGSVRHNQLTLERECGGNGQPAGCIQVYMATMDGSITGTWSGSLAGSANNIWRLVPDQCDEVHGPMLRAGSNRSALRISCVLTPSQTPFAGTWSTFGGSGTLGLEAVSEVKGRKSVDFYSGGTASCVSGAAYYTGYYTGSSGSRQVAGCTNDSGRHLTGWYKSGAGEQHGPFSITLSADGTAFTGTYDELSSSGTGRGPYDGNLKP